jgi:glycerophosphoryl diester phosphodiesterase
MRKSPVLLIHRAANGPHTHPPNSIRGLQACLDAGSRVVEMDISPLADGDFVLLHGPLLEGDTNSSGRVNACTTGEVVALRLTRQGVVTDEAVGLLSQALELLSRHPRPVELQLDFQPHAHLDDAVLSRLAVALGPVKDCVRVTSAADWVLRRLRALDADLPLGFDPMFYLDILEHKERAPTRPPFRLGAYGYWDDHPLAARRWGHTSDYLAARAEALWAQAPPGVIWYIRAPLLARALDDGFDWMADLHARGVEVDAWTLNPSRPEHIALARRLMAVGVDRITTDDAPALARALGDGVEF